MESRPATARTTRMAAGRALFDALSPLARRTWTVQRIAAWCGVSSGTVSGWLGPDRRGHAARQLEAHRLATADRQPGPMGRSGPRLTG